MMGAAWIAAAGPLGSGSGTLNFGPLGRWPWTLGLGVRAVVRRGGGLAVGPWAIAPIPSRVPWAFSQMMRNAVLGPRPPIERGRSF